MPDDGELVPGLDAKKLALVGRNHHRRRPVDADRRLVNGKPKVVPAKPGVTYEPDDVSAASSTWSPRPAASARWPSRRRSPSRLHHRDAHALRIHEQVSTFTTYFPYAEYRNLNIGRAAELIDGTVLKPGETFSLNDTVGERTEDNGFTKGFIISNGIFKEDLGGGVSQMATTTFNAVFFAGLEDVEHKPHSFYIDRYPSAARRPSRGRRRPAVHQQHRPTACCRRRVRQHAVVLRAS